MLVFPSAKINIGLHVIARRIDGYHDLQSVFYPVPLHDTIEIHANSEKKLILRDKTPNGSGIPHEDNILIKTWNLLNEEIDIPGITVDLLKYIPYGGGLGGGSSDAAFLIKACNALFRLNLSLKDQVYLAQQLGSDCPFFIHNKPSYVTGTGHQIEPFLLNLSDFYLCLIHPGINSSTQEAYAGIKSKPASIDLKSFLSENTPEKWKNVVVNDFEVSLFKKYPRLALLKNELYKAGALYASMSGSGSTVYGIFSENPQITACEKWPNDFVWCGKMTADGF
jgi:4-diphosphocytidyl-2-C-methyl-D-erythritol kinase